MGSDLQQLVIDSFTDKFTCNFSLRTSHIGSTEQKLSIQVGNVNCVHIYDVYLFKTSQREILQDLTPQPAGADNQDFGGFEGTP